MRLLPVLAFCSVSLIACGGEGRSTDTSTADSAAPPAGAAGGAASAPMRDAAGRELGTLAVAEGAAGITLSGTLRGLSPGEHGIHLHTVGRCEAPFESAGSHWNPTSRQHGAQSAQGPHLGDLPNVTVGADSTAAVQITTPGGTLRGDNAALDGDGAAVVVHAGADDYRTDPAGNSGDRIACGVVSGS